MIKRSVYVVCFMVLFVVAVGVPELLAQTSPPPPALPGMPDQAPIDGGLSILAAAGGAYAWRKLRNKRS
jgi:hypothetical protein